MLQLVNLSNYKSDLELIHNSAECLQTFLNQHHLDGLEMMFCDRWDQQVHKKEWIQGVHLRFWPTWLDFWRQNQKQLLIQFANEEEIKACYGGVTPQEWLTVYRDNIRTAVQAGAKYVVFHVSQARMPEVFTWQFSATDQEVIEATIEVVNELVASIPEDMEILFENLWWPGLTLKNKELTALLMEKVNHPKVGIMLDTGHLMNTNSDLRTQAEGVAYILEILENLGEYKSYIHGIHLHHSLSGEYVTASQEKMERQHTMTEIMTHVLRIDEHLPFSIAGAQQIIAAIQPRYVVHEFMYKSIEDWSEKIYTQKQALVAKEES